MLVCCFIAGHSVSSSLPGLTKNRIWNADLPDIVHGGYLTDPVALVGGQTIGLSEELRVLPQSQGMAWRAVILALSQCTQTFYHLDVCSVALPERVS